MTHPREIGKKIAQAKYEAKRDGRPVLEVLKEKFPKTTE